MEDVADRCQMSRSYFNMISAHLRKGNFADDIELEMFEQSLDILRNSECTHSVL